MQLQKALAEGKVSLKGPNEPATDEDSPDKLIEMQGNSSSSQGQSHRRLMEQDRYQDGQAFSERFGNVHMNETALEYFQNANLAGKSSE